MKRVLLMAALAVLLVPGAAMADTVYNFAGTGYYTGVSSMTFGPITVYSWQPAASGSSNPFYDPSVLFQRDVPSDRGLGVCSEGASACLGPNGQGIGTGDTNELDNMGGGELISLSLATGYSWVSVAVSSLDSNSNTVPERGELYACDSADPNQITTCALIAQFAGGWPPEQTFAIPTAYEHAAGLFFVPVDWTGGGNQNNDYLVNAATVRATPEAATLSLLGLGLGSLALALKRRKK